jgi:hypothetical protein
MDTLMNNETRDYIHAMEDAGYLDPDCKTCVEVFYSQILNGKDLTTIHAPSHKPSPRCESGKRPHCTCDTCF